MRPIDACVYSNAGIAANAHMHSCCDLAAITISSVEKMFLQLELGLKVERSFVL